MTTWCAVLKEMYTSTTTLFRLLCVSAFGQSISYVSGYEKGRTHYHRNVCSSAHVINQCMVLYYNFLDCPSSLAYIPSRPVLVFWPHLQTATGPRTSEPCLETWSVTTQPNPGGYILKNNTYHIPDQEDTSEGLPLAQNTCVQDL